MTRFIALTNDDGETIYLNPNHIMIMSTSQTSVYSILRLLHNVIIYVKQDIEYISNVCANTP